MNASYEDEDPIDISGFTHELVRAVDGPVVVHDETFGNFEHTVEVKMVQEGEKANSQKDYWCRKAILILINGYEKYHHEIKSHKVRNKTVFGIIAEEIREAGFNYTPTQCIDKLKNLKKQYHKYQNSLKQDGIATTKFQFVKEFDNLFGSQGNSSPVVDPLSIASSLRSSNITLSDDKEETGTTSGKKRKRNTCDIEDNVERRHRERIMVAERAIESFEKCMQALINKL